MSSLEMFHLSGSDGFLISDLFVFLFFSYFKPSEFTSSLPVAHPLPKAGLYDWHFVLIKAKEDLCFLVASQ